MTQRAWGHALMPGADVHQLAAQLQAHLGLSIICGQVTLNFNNGDLQSVETKTYQRVIPRPPVDKRPAVRV